MDPSQIKKRIGRFRILVIGRANAGKTTILQRVCNTRDNPEIRNCAGKKIDPALLKASRDRGLHDIENEMVFQSNPGFVFHDSRGFEAGGESEFDKVKAFIASRSKEPELKDQLHAIWYCIPMDEESRSFTQGEIKFFSQCDTGSIPVMVLFTKFDALYDVAYAQLKSKGASMEEAKELAPKHAEESFANGPQLKFLKDVRWPPKCHVCLPNMDKDDADCGPLIERTAGIMDNAVLRQLFVSTQQTNLELCMKYALERILSEVFDYAKTTPSEAHENIIGRLGAWFPHIWANDPSVLNNFPHSPLSRVRRNVLPHSPLSLVREVLNFLLQLVPVPVNLVVEVVVEPFLPPPNLEHFLESHQTVMRSRLLSVASSSSPLESILQLSSAVVIIFEHSFFIFDKRRYLRDQQESDPSFYAALDQYTASPHAVAVREGVSAAVLAYEEAMKTAVYTHQGSLPAWIAKLQFKWSQKKQAKAELIKTTLEITLNHRLPRP